MGSKNALQKWASSSKSSGGGSFDEDKHPRDKDGKFPSGGGGGGGGESTEVHIFDVRPPVEGKRTWTDKLPEGMKAETWMSHYDKSPWEGGKPTAERFESVHKPLIDAALNVKPAAPGEQKMAILTMGAPASGKSSALAGIDTSKYVKVDPDGLMEHIPEYKASIADKDNTFKGAANMAHTEAADIGDRVIEGALKNGNHVVIDGTGFNKDSMIKRIKMLQEQGYRVHVAMPHLSVEDGMQRLLSRADKTGRLVPEDFARKAYAGIPKNFFDIAKAADTSALFDNSGKEPRLVFESKRGHADKTYDKDFMRDFRTQRSGVDRD